MSLRLVERTFSDREECPSIMLANLHGTIDMAQNLSTLEQVIELAHDSGANMVVFPELAVTGYVWDTPRREDVVEHLRAGEIGGLRKWLRNVQDSLHTDGKGLEYIFLGNVREAREGLYNSMFILHPGVDYADEELTYDKIFIPHNEQHYFRRGSDKRLTIDTKWGRLGFMICYDLCFVELARRYAFIDHVDAIVTLASWRSEATREYADMNIKTDHYYGFLWDLMNSSKASYNQVWSLGANAVGTHDLSGVMFWGGSGVWAPSGMRLLQASNVKQELLLIRNLDITGQRLIEHDDFNYRIDFQSVYRPMESPEAAVEHLE